MKVIKMDTSIAKKNKLIEKINEFTDYFEDELRLISKIISAVMLGAYTVISWLVIGKLGEYNYSVAFGMGWLWFLAVIFAMFGWAFCYAGEDELPKYRIFLSPIVITLFIFGGLAVLLTALMIVGGVCYVGFIGADYISDVIVELLI